MGVTALYIKKVCLRCVAVIIVAFVMPTGIWLYARSASRFGRVAAVAAGVAMGEYKPYFSADDDSKATVQTAYPSKLEAAVVSKHSIWDMDMAPQEKQTPSVSAEVPSPLPAQDVTDKIPYPASMEGNDGVIEKYTYGRYDGEQYFDLDGGGQVRNCTELSNDELYEESSKPYDFQIDGNSSEPQILIYHTHATESFEPTDKDHYDSSFSCKTTEPEMNMLSVGDKICEQLDKAGVAYIHDTLVHDYPSYDGSYDSSRMAVKQILEEYPSIKVCLDVHRDGIEREDGTRLAPVAEIDGREAAQLMIISGCDDGTMGMPDYMKNFHFACALQSALESDWQGLTRPVLFDYRHYNQDLTTGSLLIEVGSHGNSITQAQYTGELIGKTLGKMFGGE